MTEHPRFPVRITFDVQVDWTDPADEEAAEAHRLLVRTVVERQVRQVLDRYGYRSGPIGVVPGQGNDPEEQNGFVERLGALLGARRPPGGPPGPPEAS